MTSRWVVLFVCLAVGCVKPTEATQCGDFTCGLGAICSPDGSRCVAPDTVYACNGLVDGDRCTYTGVPDGVCQASICIPGGCGNGIVEAALGEICDDANFVSGDGCRADCLSAEVCGDGIQDLAANELCDCGTGSSSIGGCNGPNSETPGATCRTDCTFGRCGDTVIDPGEYCDDGNNRAGDGCRADCTGRWTKMDSKTYLDLAGVWGSDATHVFAVGDSRVLRFDGLEWNVMPILDAMKIKLVSVSGSGPNDVMVRSDGRLFHYNGSWTDVTPPTPSGQIKGLSITAASITGPSDGWMVAIDSTNWYVFRWNGSAWVQQPSNPPFISLVEVSQIWSSSPSDVYANVYAPSPSSTTLWHFNGTTWSIFQDASSNIHATLLAGSSATDIVAITRGSSPVNNSYYHFTGTTWPSAPCCDDVITMKALGGAANDYILVGTMGQIMRFDGSAWSIESADVSVDLYGIWGYATGHAFIVGDDGTILY